MKSQGWESCLTPPRGPGNRQVLHLRWINQEQTCQHWTDLYCNCCYPDWPPNIPQPLNPFACLHSIISQATTEVRFQCLSHWAGHYTAFQSTWLTYICIAEGICLSLHDARQMALTQLIFQFLSVQQRDNQYYTLIQFKSHWETLCSILCVRIETKKNCSCTVQCSAVRMTWQPQSCWYSVYLLIQSLETSIMSQGWLFSKPSIPLLTLRDTYNIIM